MYPKPCPSRLDEGGQLWLDHYASKRENGVKMDDSAQDDSTLGNRPIGATKDNRDIGPRLPALDEASTPG
jgi:hypothetical protein